MIVWITGLQIERSDTNKDEKWVLHLNCYSSSSNSDIWFLFLHLQQNLFFVTTWFIPKCKHVKLPVCLYVIILNRCIIFLWTTSLARRLRRFIEYYGTFQNQGENMSQVIYYHNRQCKLYDTLIYIYIDIDIFGDQSLSYTNIWEHIYKALHQYCIIRISDCRTNVLTAVLECFHNNPPEQIQHTSVSNQCCRYAAKPPTKNQTTYQPQEENPVSTSQSLIIIRTLPRYKDCDRAPMNTLHCNYLLLQ